jgi:uncharacterized protein (TIGR02145 family)
VSNVVTYYGRLYTWYAVTDSRNVCPTGWHIPTDAEWRTLTNYLTNNGYGYQGSGNDIAKSMAAKLGWANFPDLEAGMVGNDQTSNNRSGFSAFPGGIRFSDGSFVGFGGVTYFWSATEYNIEDAWFRVLDYSSIQAGAGSHPKNSGNSVRCLKD